MSKFSITNYLDNPGQYMETVKKDWEKFVENKTDEGLSVRDEVLQSWAKSVKSGIPYLQKGARVVLDEQEMQKIYLKNSMLMQASGSILDEFISILKVHKKSSVIVNLCDADTVILKTLTNNDDARSASEDHHLLPGAILNEEYTGTTGVSMVKNTQEPYVIYGSEHFNVLAKTWSCAAAPIRNVNTKKMVGIVSITGNNLNISTEAFGMITFVARAIEGEILSEFTKRMQLLNDQFREALPHSKADLLIAIDIDMHVVSSSKNRHPVLEDFYESRELRTEVKEHFEFVADRIFTSKNNRQKKNDQTTFTASGHNFFITPVYLQTELIGCLMEVYPIPQKVGARSDSASASASLYVPDLIGSSEAFISVLSTAKHVAVTDAPVILTGETGVGKEGFAKTIHNYSNRVSKPFIAINCGAIPKELIGSELFGYAPGAFTGALAKGNPGKLEAANNGTLFLDELAELPLDAQTYLLRVLEEKSLVRLGSTQALPIDVRIIAATNADIEQMVAEKLFRSDLYYRLNVIQIKIPPLRERLDDLADLISFFHSSFSGQSCTLTKEDISFLSRYTWPGNIRELKNVIQSANILGKNVILSLRDYVKMHSLDESNQNNLLQSDQNTGISPQLDDARIMEVIQSCNGNIAEAARQLGVARSTIYRRFKK